MLKQDNVVHLWVECSETAGYVALKQHPHKNKKNKTPWAPFELPGSAPLPLVLFVFFLLFPPHKSGSAGRFSFIQHLTPGPLPKQLTKLSLHYVCSFQAHDTFVHRDVQL